MHTINKPSVLLGQHLSRRCGGVVTQAAQRPNPGSKRKVSSSDLARLSKIFGPSRYTTAYGPPEEPPPPPPNAPASSSTTNGGTGSAEGRSSSARRTGPPPQATRSPAVAWAQSVLAQHQDDSARGKAIREGADSLQQLIALSRETGARKLGPIALLAVADRAWSVATVQGIVDEQELQDVQTLGEFLVLATHPFITGGAYTTADLSLLLRTPLCLNHPPSTAWLKACESAALKVMLLKAQRAQQAQQQVEQGEGIDEEEEAHAYIMSLAEEADGILGMSASFLGCSFDPRPEFKAMFMDVAAAYMQLSEQQCIEAEEAFSRAADAKRVGRRGGLIEVPEQLEVDEVLMADGSNFTAVDQQQKDKARAQQQQQQQQQEKNGKGGAVTAETLCVVNSFNWNTICEAVLRWGYNEAPNEWIQTFVDASYAAMRASVGVMATEMEGADESMQVGRPLVSRVLDTSVLANIMTVAIYAFSARPPQEWVDTQCALCQMVLEHVREHGGQEESAQVASGGLVANPASLVNILSLLRFMEREPGPGLVNAALGAVSKSYGGAGLQLVAGDALAMLMFETGRHHYELDESASAAALELAIEAQTRWARARQERMDAEARRRGRTVQVQQDKTTAETAAAEDEADAAEEAKKEFEFTKYGMIHILEGASSLGVMPQLSREWILLWGEEAMMLAEEFDAEDVIVCLSSAANAGVSLSPASRTKLVGRMLELAAPKPVPESASISGSSSSSSSSSTNKAKAPSAGREMMTLDKLRDMMEALLMQVDGTLLPGAWMERMQALVEAYLPAMSLSDIVMSMKVLGLLEVAPSETFLQQAVAAYTACLARELGVTSAANDQDSGASGAASEMLENAADKQDSGAAGVKVDGAADKQDSSELQRDNATDMRVSAANVLARDEEACLNLASGLAAAGAPAHIFQIIEDASLQWSASGGPVALDYWVSLLAKFASGAHLPQQKWWEGLAAATGSINSSSDSSIESNSSNSSTDSSNSFADAQLSNLLAAYGALRAQHGPDVDQRGGAWATQLALQAAERLERTAVNATSSSPAGLQATMALVGGLGTLFVVPINPSTPLYPHVPRVCGAIETATLAQAPLLSPYLVSACFSVFSPVGHTPGAAWLEAAAAAAVRGLPSADGHDLATLLEACNSVPAFATHIPTPAINTLLRTAVQEGAAGGLQPGQLLSLVNSAAGLQLDARVGAPHATQLRTLLEQASLMKESLPPVGVASLLENAAILKAQPPARWLDAMLSCFESVDFLGPEFGGPEPMLRLLAALDTYDHHPLPPWLRTRLCEALPGLADMGVHAMRLIQRQERQKAGESMQGSQSERQQGEGAQVAQSDQQQEEWEVPLEGEEGEAMLEAAQEGCMQCSHASVLLMQYLANTSVSPRVARASSNASASSSGRTPVSRRAAETGESTAAAGIPPGLLAPTLTSFKQLVEGRCLPNTDHAGLVYSLARLSPAPAKPGTPNALTAQKDASTQGSDSSNSSSNSSSNTSSSSKSTGTEAEVDKQVAAVTEARSALLQALLPATASALPSYSLLELMTVFSALGALGADLPQSWLDVFWEYSRPQLRVCPAGLLVACLDAVTALGVRPAGAWESGLWEALSVRAPKMGMKEMESLLLAILKAQLRPPPALLQNLLQSALSSAQLPAASPSEVAAASAAATAAAVKQNTQSSTQGEKSEKEVVGSTRMRRSERQSSASSSNTNNTSKNTSNNTNTSTSNASSSTPSIATGSGSDSAKNKAEEEAATAVQIGGRAVQLARVLSVVRSGFDYQPSAVWTEEFRGAVAAALGMRQLSASDRTMLMEVMQAPWAA